MIIYAIAGGIHNILKQCMHRILWTDTLIVDMMMGQIPGDSSGIA